MSRNHPEFANILAGRYSTEQVRALLTPRDAWHPFPTIDDRDAWQNLPVEQRDSLLKAGEDRLGMSWPELKASVYLEYTRNGNRINYETPHFERRTALADLVLAECIEDQGRFLDDIINGTWALMEESFWGVNAHTTSKWGSKTPLPDTVDRYVDLFAAETGALLAWASYLVKPRLNVEVPQIPQRIHHEIEQRIFTPFLANEDWQWMVNEPNTGRAPNNWNPWINSNILAMALLEESDEDRRAAMVSRCMMLTDRFLSGYFSDGGCDEGTMYWGRAGGSLFDCLDIIARASNDQLSWWDVPLIQEIGRYIYRLHIGDAWYVNFADGPAKGRPDAGLIYRYAVRIEDPLLQAQSAAINRASEAAPVRGESMGRRIANLFEPIPAEVRASPTPLIPGAWLDGIEVLAVRENPGSADGLFLAAKGGHNDESHNHNDIGSFIVALNGVPAIIDAGVETYSRKTFGPDRYEIWTMQSQYHNLPTVNGIGQSPGYAFAARGVSASLDDTGGQLTLDIAGAYPPEAGIERWQRAFTFTRGTPTEITLVDQWQLATEPENIVFSLMTWQKPVIVSETELSIPGHNGALTVIHSEASAATERVLITDERLGPVWGDAVWRILLTPASISPQGEFRFVIQASTPESR